MFQTKLSFSLVHLLGLSGNRKSPSLQGAVRGPRSEELPLAIPEIPVERELKLDESPTTPSSQSKAALTCQCSRIEKAATLAQCCCVF